MGARHMSRSTGQFPVSCAADITQGLPLLEALPSTTVDGAARHRSRHDLAGRFRTEEMRTQSMDFGPWCASSPGVRLLQSIMEKAGSIKLLIADDSALLRGCLMDAVSRFPEFRIVDEVTDARQAVESVVRHKPDVVILDIQMPGGSGIEVLESIKQHQPSPVVIMFTNYPYPQYRTKCMETGADFFFDKSLEFDALIETLKNLAFQLGSDTGLQDRDAK